MIVLNVNDKNKLNIEIRKKFSNRGDFFLFLMRKIDEFKIADFSIQVGNFKKSMDFSYDFLSIYNFLNNVLIFVNAPVHDKTKFYLLLYERGEDKLRFEYAQDNTIQICYLDADITLGSENRAVDSLNREFKSLLNSVNEIKTHFILNEKHASFFDEWTQSISKEIKL